MVEQVGSRVNAEVDLASEIKRIHPCLRPQGFQAAGRNADAKTMCRLTGSAIAKALFKREYAENPSGTNPHACCATAARNNSLSGNRVTGRGPLRIQRGTTSNVLAQFRNAVYETSNRLTITVRLSELRNQRCGGLTMLECRQSFAYDSC